MEAVDSAASSCTEVSKRGIITHLFELHLQSLHLHHDTLHLDKRRVVRHGIGGRIGSSGLLSVVSAGKTHLARRLLPFTLFRFNTVFRQVVVSTTRRSLSLALLNFLLDVGLDSQSQLCILRDLVQTRHLALAVWAFKVPLKQSRLNALLAVGSLAAWCPDRVMDEL